PLLAGSRNLSTAESLARSGATLHARSRSAPLAAVLASVPDRPVEFAARDADVLEHGGIELKGGAPEPPHSEGAGGALKERPGAGRPALGKVPPSGVGRARPVAKACVGAFRQRRQSRRVAEKNGFGHWRLRPKGAARALRRKECRR